MRESAPASFRTWQVQQESEHDAFLSTAAQWMASTTYWKGVCQERVYENPAAGQIDFRQHRSNLCALIAEGENLAVQLIAGLKGSESDAIVTQLDAKVSELLAVLFQWHGPIDAQSDVPESFKAAAREVGQGVVIDFDEARLTS